LCVFVRLSFAWMCFLVFFLLLPLLPISFSSSSGFLFFSFVVLYTSLIFFFKLSEPLPSYLWSRQRAFVVFFLLFVFFFIIFALCWTYAYVKVYSYLYMCVCVCLCVSEVCLRLCGPPPHTHPHPQQHPHSNPHRLLEAQLLLTFLKPLCGYVRVNVCV
jgi:hypothetical protein